MKMIARTSFINEISLQFLFYHINNKSKLWNEEYKERNKGKPKNPLKSDCFDYSNRF